MGALLHAEGPLWAFEQVIEQRDVLTPVPGVVLPLYFDRNEIDDDALEVLKTEITYLVKDFYRTRTERAERLNTD